MKNNKYPIKAEFKPYSLFTPPINKPFLKFVNLFMKPPRKFFKDKDLIVTKKKVLSFDKKEIELFIISPKNISANASCLVYFHGGGFVLEGAKYHYELPMIYAKRLNCKVIYVKYRLAPKYPFPIPFEDSYEALKWVYNHTKELKIDKEKIGVCGDSAGATLATSSLLMAKDRNFSMKIKFQMLIYPYLDRRGISDSFKKFYDTPMWNSSLSKKITPIFCPDESKGNIIYTSPVEANLDGMPPTYIETAEFDPLHDDGILYAKLLKEKKIDVTLNETKNTMHGFDIVINAPTTKMMIEKRIQFMKNYFNI